MIFKKYKRIRYYENDSPSTKDLNYHISDIDIENLEKKFNNKDLFKKGTKIYISDFCRISKYRLSLLKNNITEDKESADLIVIPDIKYKSVSCESINTYFSSDESGVYEKYIDSDSVAYLVDSNYLDEDKELSAINETISLLKKKGNTNISIKSGIEIVKISGSFYDYLLDNDNFIYDSVIEEIIDSRLPKVSKKERITIEDLFNSNDDSNADFACNILLNRNIGDCLMFLTYIFIKYSLRYDLIYINKDFFNLINYYRINKSFNNYSLVNLICYIYKLGHNKHDINFYSIKLLEYIVNNSNLDITKLNERLKEINIHINLKINNYGVSKDKTGFQIRKNGRFYNR